MYSRNVKVKFKEQMTKQTQILRYSLVVLVYNLLARGATRGSSVNFNIRKFLAW